MELMFWRAVWALALKMRLWRVLALRCPGKQPALCWIPPTHPGAGDGYYRSGILAQYCQLPRDHEHLLCLAPIDHFGDRKRGGSWFVPDIHEGVAA